MKNLNLKLVALILSTLIINSIDAQNWLQINFTNQNSQEISFEDLRVLRFDNENMYVTKKDNQSYTVQLDLLRSLAFTDISSQVEALTLGADLDLIVYPNPVSEKLHILLPKTTVSDGRITLYNNNGELVQQIIERGNDRIEMFVGDLAPGLYLIRFSSDKKAATVKFIKK